ncbi:MAG: ABC transporter permease [Parafilimonas terrae]|nr:ABC transporter permease [Parafilimonas terrae]
MSTVEAPASELVVEHQVTKAPVSLRQHVGVAAALVVIGLLTLWLFGLRGHHDHDAKLRLGAANDLGAHQLNLPAIPVAMVCGVLVLALAALWSAVPHRRLFGWVMGAGLGLFLLALLCWLASGSQYASVDLVGLAFSSIQLAVPLILGALCGVMCERSGVINVAIEGEMAAGAWAGALFGSILGSSYLGTVAGALAGAAVGAVLAVFAIRYLVNQVVLGVVLNVFALGLCGFFYNAFMQQHSESLNSPALLDNWNVPLLSKIPIVGPIFFQTSFIVYLTYILVIAVDIWLFRTRWGLRTRAVGEHPKAADTVGIKVRGMRYRNVILGGAIAGLAGAFLTFNVGQFSANITSGNGFIALAALIFGRWNPRGATAAALFFGFATAMQIPLSTAGIPSGITGMVPYVATILAVAGLVGHARAPAADGEPYVKS